jgi:hypothetical protein
LLLLQQRGGAEGYQAITRGLLSIHLLLHRVRRAEKMVRVAVMQAGKELRDPRR